MLNSDYDKKIEQLMNDEGLSHKEAMAKLDGMKKKSKSKDDSSDDSSADDSEGEFKSIELPQNLLPSVPEGKEIDVSICGKVTGVSDGMVQIDARRFSVSVMDPMPKLEVARDNR